MLLFNAAGFLCVYALMRLQGLLPLNPAGMSAVAPDLTFNTAVSFATNTNWQNYGGESTLSYLTPDGRPHHAEFRLGRHRHRARRRADSRLCARLGARPWAISGSTSRAARSTCCCRCRIIAALILVWQGVPQNLGAYVDATTLEGAKQVISQGPAASQIAIKQLGTNGGGFWNANSAVPYENPTPLSNFVEALYILLISAALTHTFGRMVEGRAAGLGALRRHVDPLLRRCRCLLLGGRLRQSAIRRARARSRQYGREGGPLRHRQFEPLGGRHHRCLQRLGQFHARQLHAARRDDPASDMQLGEIILAASAQASTACCSWSLSPSSSRA